MPSRRCPVAGALVAGAVALFLSLPLAAGAAQAPAARQDASAPVQADTAPRLFAETTRLRQAGQLAEAEGVAERLVALVVAAGDAAWEDQSVAYNTLGQIQYERGDYAGAERSLAQVVRLRRAHPGSDAASLAQALANLAQVKQGSGDAEGAVPLFVEARALLARVAGPDGAETATTLAAARGLALAYQALGRDDEAAPLLERVLAAREASLGPEHAEVGRARSDLGALRLDQGRLDEAERLLRRALAIEEAALGAQHPDTASTLMRLAALYQSQDRLDQAKLHLERALDARRGSLGARHPDTRDTLARLAVVRARAGDALGAVRDGAEALDAAEYLLRLSLPAASDAERERRSAEFLDETDLAISLHLEYAPSSVAAARLALTTVLRRKGRLLDSLEALQQATRSRLDASGQEQVDAIGRWRRDLASMVLAGGGRDSTEAHAAAIAALEQRIDEAEAALEHDYVAFRRAPAPVAVDEVQEGLASDMALVEFIVHRPWNARAARAAERFGPPRYIAYIVTPKGQVQWADLGETGPIDEAVRQFRDALRDPRRMDVVNLARRLDVLVFEPWTGKVAQARHLVIAPDGLLNVVPFAALADRRGTYRVSQYLISYLSSGRDLAGQVVRTAQEPALVVAAPGFGTAAAPVPANAGDGESAAGGKLAIPSRAADLAAGHFTPLPETEIEGRTIQSILPGARLLTGADANTARLRAVEGPAVLHIASHAFIRRDPASPPAGPITSLVAESGQALRQVRLALAGATRAGLDATDPGLLNGDDMAALMLQGTSLVMLSALETGEADAGAAAGVFALRRALHLAGSDTQVLSLWQVSERVTNEAAPNVYRHLRDGVSRAEAVRRAQRTLASTPRTAHPYYWAPFVLSGNWREMRDVFREGESSDPPIPRTEREAAPPPHSDVSGATSACLPPLTRSGRREHQEAARCRGAAALAQTVSY